MLDDSSDSPVEHIYSTLKSLDSKIDGRRNSLDNEDDDDDGVYATVNFNRSSTSSITSHEKPHYQDISFQSSVSKDVSDLYAKVDMKKKKSKQWK